MSAPQTCYTDPITGCVHCGPVPYQPEVPARWESDPIQGWDGGARSIETLDGNVRIKFEAGPSMGVVIGLSDPDQFDLTRPDTIQQGFYLWSQGSGLLGQAIEHGVPRGETFEREPDDLFEIRRINGTAYYLQGDNLVHTSFAPSATTVCVGACLYRTDDTVY